MGGTRQWSRQYEGRMVQAKDPMGREIYWFPVVPVREAEEGTDRWAVEHGWISVTPLRLDLTNDIELAKLAAAPTAAHPEGGRGGGGEGKVGEGKGSGEGEQGLPSVLSFLQQPSRRACRAHVQC